MRSCGAGGEPDRGIARRRRVVVRRGGGELERRASSRDTGGEPRGGSRAADGRRARAGISAARAARAADLCTARSRTAPAPSSWHCWRLIRCSSQAAPRHLGSAAAGYRPRARREPRAARARPPPVIDRLAVCTALATFPRSRCEARTPRVQLYLHRAVARSRRAADGQLPRPARDSAAGRSHNEVGTRIWRRGYRRRNGRRSIRIPRARPR